MTAFKEILSYAGKKIAPKKNILIAGSLGVTLGIGGMVLKNKAYPDSLSATPLCNSGQPYVELTLTSANPINIKGRDLTSALFDGGDFVKDGRIHRGPYYRGQSDTAQVAGDVSPDILKAYEGTLPRMDPMDKNSLKITVPCRRPNLLSQIRSIIHR